MGWLRVAGLLVLGIASLLAGASLPAAAQGSGATGTGTAPTPGRGTRDSLVRELVRKADAREAESGFCRGIGWPAGDPRTYVQFLEQAVAGSNKVNTFQNAQNCQYDRVDVVFRKAGTHCVTYTWWACAGGGGCGRGLALACRARDGSWDTENSK